MVDLDFITKPGAEDYFRARRWRSTAETWIEKVSAALIFQFNRTESKSLKSLLSDDAGHFVITALQEIYTLVPMLQEEDAMYTLDDVEREAKILVKRLKDFRLAQKMENMSGRTLEEAEAFRKKAEELKNA